MKNQGIECSVQSNTGNGSVIDLIFSSDITWMVQICVTDPYAILWTALCGNLSLVLKS